MTRTSISRFARLALAIGVIAGAGLAAIPDSYAKHPNASRPSAKPMSCFPKTSRFAICGSYGGTKLVGFQVRF